MEDLKKSILVHHSATRKLKEQLIKIIEAVEAGQEDAGSALLGTALTSAGGNIVLDADLTLADAIQAIIDTVDPEE